MTCIENRQIKFTTTHPFYRRTHTTNIIIIMSWWWRWMLEWSFFGHPNETEVVAQQEQANRSPSCLSISEMKKQLDEFCQTVNPATAPATATITATPTKHRNAQKMTQVPHVKQIYSWDCGLACVQMVRQTSSSKTTGCAPYRPSTPTTSIWTLDLVHILSQHHVPHIAFTQAILPQHSHTQFSFYNDTFAQDLKRLQSLLARTTTTTNNNNDCHSYCHFYPIHLVSRVPITFILETLKFPNIVAIVLVDAHKLQPPHTASTTSNTHTSSFVGHYLLLMDYYYNNNNKNNTNIDNSSCYMIDYHDPADSNNHGVVSSMTVSTFQNAYHTQGTDQDVIFCKIGVEEQHAS